MRRCVVLAALALAATVPRSVYAARPPRLDPVVLGRAKAATVLVLTESGSGSGFVVAAQEGRLLVVTNEHVIRPRSGQTSATIQVVLDSGDEAAIRRPAALLGTDREADLALLSFAAPRRGPEALPLAAQCRLEPGLPVYVVGFPFGALLGADGLLPAVSINSGVAAAHRATVIEARDLLQVAAGINPGNSGGPVVDALGTVIGAAVAHFRGTEESFVVPCEAVAALLRRLAPGARYALRALAPLPSTEPPSTEPPSSEPPSSAPAPERLRRALVLVRNDGEPACGFVWGSRAGELLVLTNHHAVHDARGRRRARVEVTFAGRGSRAATILRSDPETDVALLAAPDPGGVEALPIADAGRLVETSHLRVAGFRPGSLTGAAALQTSPEIQDATVVSLRHGRGRQLLAVQVDAGINGGNTGGPVIDERGAVVGVAVIRGQGTNVSLVVPGEAVRDLLRGGLRGGGVKWAHDGKASCVYEAWVEVDDPLRELVAVGLVVEDAGVQTLAPGGNRLVVPLGPVRAEARLASSGAATLAAVVTPCPAREPPRFQIVTYDARRQQQVSLPYALAPPRAGSSYAVATFRGTYQAGDREVDARSFLSTPPRAPGWSNACQGPDLAPCRAACDGGDPSSCVKLADRIAGARGDPGAARQAAPLYRRACDAGVAGGCHGLALLALDRLAPGTDTERVALEERACTGGIARGCDAVGIALRDGQGVARDLARAAALFGKACDLSDGLGCRLLAELTFDGRGVARSAQQSAWLYQKGCSLSDAG
ncbi:MAG TPA: trypsin-like peptidase domain-containing protein, partial [Thermoleophilia bacterium]|nr:trypsin-like peptidase domain-containing protein [Thermoleophilia bacterium]